MTRPTLIRRSLVAAAGAAAISAIAVGTAFADDNRGPGMMRGAHGRGRPILALLCMVAIAGAAIVATWLIIRRRPQAALATSTPAFVPPAAPSPTAAAEGILAERLARSEISPDDYRSMLAALRETNVANAAAAPSSAATPAAPEDAS